MSFASSSWHRRPQSQSSRTFVAYSDVSSNLSRAKSIKNVKFEAEQEEPYIDPSIPKGRGEGLGLPDFLKKRAMQPRVVDPMEQAFQSRAAAGSLKKANPKAPKPVEEFFKLKQLNKGPLDTESEASAAIVAKKPPKAVYVKKNRQELYDHKLELKPFNWYDQKGAKATLNNFLQENVKQKGEITDVQEKIRAKIGQSRDIMRNFDKENNLKTADARDPDVVNPAEKIDAALSVKIWEAFGKYIAKNLKSGRAIHVPKFGQFTFTFPNHLKMAGLTNPGERDQQIRTPVFVMGKDFVQGVKLKAGIAGSWAHDIHVKETRSMISSSASDLLSQFTDVTTGGSKNTIIPFELRNNNGIVPKHDINYVEISLAVGSKLASKQTCKEHCELICKKYAARAAAGKRVEASIPHVGKLSISIGICAVIFNRDIIDDARGKTAINYKDRHHTADVSRWNNLMNGKELEKDRNKAPQGPSFDALKKKLDREYDQKNNTKSIENMMAEIDERFHIAQRQKALQADTKLEIMQNMMRQRPGSAYGAKSVRSLRSYRSKQSSMRALSRGFGGSVAGSAMSVVPELDPAILMSIAWEVYGLRTRLVPKAKQQQIGLREQLTSSKLQKLLQAVGYNIKIGNMKALLKELGFNWNGSSCSVTQLIEKLKVYTREPHIEPLNALIQAERLEAQQKTNLRQLPVDQETLHKIIKSNEPHPSFQTLGELIYNQEKSLHDVFEEYKTVNGNGKTVLGFLAFEKMARRYATNLWSAKVLRAMFDAIPRALPDFLSFNEFEAAFEIAVPEKAVLQSQYPEAKRHVEEQRIVTKVLEWLHRRGYPAEDAFERLLRAVSRSQQKTLRRYDFQKAIKSEAIGLSTPEIDFLFDLLAGNDRQLAVSQALIAYRAGETTKEQLDQTLAANNREAALEIKAEHWLRKIKTVAPNPLDHIRRCVREGGHSESTLMLRLGLKLSDQPLDYAQFECAIHYIDPTCSDLQARKLFAKLKDEGGKIPINRFVKNILGRSELGTVDSQKHMLKKLYDEIYRKQKSKEFMRILENADSNNDGKLEPVQVGFFIKHVTGGADSPFTNEQIEEFVAQLPKVDNQKILYVSLLDLVTSVGNKNHNPFKSLVRKLDFFLHTNGTALPELLERLDPLRGRTDGVTLGSFAQFLKDKIEKGKDLANLESYAKLMDIDKDGRISAEDLQTCLCNIDSDQFFKNGGQNLKQTQFNAENKYFTIPVKKLGIDKSDPKIFEIRKQLARALKEQGKTLHKIFGDFDSDGDGMLNFGEFSKGIRSVMTVNQPTLEKIFNIMDENKIGMVDFEKFYRSLFVEDPQYDLIHHGEVVNHQAYDPGEPVEDSFEWQNRVVAQIKDWFKREKLWQRDLQLDPQDAFKSFDIDFDGKVSRGDLKKALTSFLDIPPKEITDIRLERLFRLLSFHKTETLQPSDFERLLGGKGPAGNPFLAPEAPLTAQENFSKSMGGGFAQTDMHDWKMAALQQIGLVLSKKYKSMEESFEAASSGSERVNFEKFREFIEKLDALRGFNLSVPLLQKLFGEIEPHKKTYMNLRDWKNAFATFNANDQLVIEFKNYMQCQFVDVPSTFTYYQTFGASPKTQIDFEQFSTATRALITNRQFTPGQLQFLFRLILGDSVFESFGAPNLKRFFAGATFTGKQKLFKRRDPVLESIGKKGDDRKMAKVQQVNSFGENILSRLRLLVQQSGKSLDEIFSQYDTDGSGELSRSEFRKALRALNLGLTILEINEIIRLVDVADLTGHTRYDKIEGDGKISYAEFAAKLYNMPANETRMLQRANGRLVLMKENMNLYMTSSNDAFRMFSQHKKGFLTFKEFEKLILKLCEYSEEKMSKPAFTVLKDMFDAVDVGKDGVIDFKEWNSTFQHMGVSDKGTKTQPEPATFGEKNAIRYTGISTWNNGPEHALIGACIAKNRNSLIKNFKEHSTHSSYDGTPRFVTFDQAKKALDALLYHNFARQNKIQITDEKLACVLSVGRLDQKLASSKPKEAPSFGYGYYEEKPEKVNPHKEGLFDFMKILDLYKQRYDLKVSVF